MKYLRVWQLGLLVAIFVLWHVLTKPGLIPPSALRLAAAAA